jgi:guanylate kinase
MKNNIFIISGPSGAGEDSVIKGIKKVLPIEKIVTTTTREKRPGEKEGVDYYFIDKKTFKEKIKKNEFYEWAKEYNNNNYGVSKQEIKRLKKSKNIVIWKIEYKGVISAKKLIPEIKAILINAPEKILIKRIKNRNKNVSNDFIKERIAYNKEWLKNKHIYDYEVINREGKLDETIEKVVNIIKKEINIDKK